MYYLFFDTETNGLDMKKMVIVQWAHELWKSKGVEKTLYESHSIISQLPPGETLSEYVTKVHGITNEICSQSLVGNKELRSYLYTLFTETLPEGTTLVGHNITFDIKVLTSTVFNFHRPFERFHVLDTMLIAQDLMKETRSVSLSKAYAHFIGNPLTNAHDARSDVEHTRELFFHMVG